MGEGQRLVHILLLQRRASPELPVCRPPTPHLSGSPASLVPYWSLVRCWGWATGGSHKRVSAGYLLTPHFQPKKLISHSNCPGSLVSFAHWIRAAHGNGYGRDGWRASAAWRRGPAPSKLGGDGREEWIHSSGGGTRCNQWHFLHLEIGPATCDMQIAPRARRGSSGLSSHPVGVTSKTGPHGAWAAYP